MKGQMKVKYKMLCDSDVYKEVTLSELLSNEKVAKVIKGEFAKGLRNIAVSSSEDLKIEISTQKEIFEFDAEKKDFADLIELAEEDAKEHKRIKKGCAGVEIVDFTTVS
jgi:antitoxin component of MazEF toxin-antitoxin module